MASKDAFDAKSIKPIRNLPQFDEQIFLTFDDGPEPGSTERVLEVLDRHQVHATFFLIATKARENMRLVGEILRLRHAIGDHSLDHRYRNYFRSTAGIERWLNAGAREWQRLGLKDQIVGFRPPAGICTPPLLRAVGRLGWPVILWNARFYDAALPWTEAGALKSALSISGGSIVLLHDRQSPNRISNFCQVLERYILALKDRGFEMASLSKAPSFTQAPKLSALPTQTQSQKN
jgi:peptidoglycan/xylan/chitin deacetylase (PgdA/CDA1 family)